MLKIIQYYNDDNRRFPTLSELTPIIFNTELEITHLGSKAYINTIVVNSLKLVHLHTFL